KGISLERQSPDEPTNGKNNFLSASTLSGGATPGYKNSTQNDVTFEKNIFSLTSKTVSPNDDGFEDFLVINYEFEHPRYMLNISIFTENGRLIRRLIQNQSAGHSGSAIWDCRSENCIVVRSGIYVFLAEIYDEKGDRKTTKGAFVITGLPSSISK